MAKLVSAGLTMAEFEGAGFAAVDFKEIGFTSWALLGVPGALLGRHLGVLGRLALRFF